MTNKLQIGLRVQPEKAEKLREYAEKQKRSVNNLIEIIIDEWLEKQEKQQ